MNAILDAINTSGLHDIIRGSLYIWPTLETLHFIGLCLLYGAIVAVDLRLVGFYKSVAYEWIHGLINVAVIGFVINLITGILFCIGDPWRYYESNSFHIKIVFLIIAGLNLLVFTFRVKDEVRHLGPGADTSLLAKIVGLTSIIAWTGVILGGRLIPFLGPV